MRRDANETDLEVRDPSVAAALLGEAVAPNRIPTRPTGVAPLQSESATTASRPWPKVYCRRLPDANENETVIASVIANENVIVTVTGSETWIALHAHAARKTASTTENGATARTTASDNTAAVRIEVRMMSSPMEMSDHQVHDAADKMTKNKARGGIHEIQR